MSRVILHLRSVPCDIPEAIRLRRLLKQLLRSFHFRCLRVEDVLDAEATRQAESLEPCRKTHAKADTRNAGAFSGRNGVSVGSGVSKSPEATGTSGNGIQPDARHGAMRESPPSAPDARSEAIASKAATHTTEGEKRARIVSSAIVEEPTF